MESSTLYSDLNSECREIRLLTIHSGPFTSKLFCDLHAASLNHNPTYLALSYCWGDGVERNDITVNGHKFSITASLATALQYLRETHNDVVVWADAICINQDHVEERNSQVRMMGNIYGRASEVWIWLGESHNDSDVAMDYINSLSSVDFEDPSYNPDPIIWAAIRNLFGRQWWSRLWILQEALLAKRAIFKCGNKSAPIENFVQLKEIELKYRRVAEKRLEPMQIGMWAPFTTMLSDWDRLRGLIASHGIPLFEMISNTERCECREPVDKIFGLLSICTALDRQIIPIDYDLPLRDLLVRVAKYHFICREMFNPLMILQTHQKDKHPNLPSWVPDYSKKDEVCHLIFPATPDCIQYTAGADNAAWTYLGLTPLPGMINEALSVGLLVEDEGNYETLVLPGLLFDIVKFAFPAPHSPFYSEADANEEVENKKKRNKDMIRACKEWEDAVVNMDLSEDQYRNTCGRYDAFWRTIIADRDYNWKGPPSAERDFAGRYKAWVGNSNDEEYTRPFSDAAIIHCMYRSLILTEKGYFGLGPSITQEGDVVSVLRGGNVPFLLRKSVDGFYSLVGESYVHGILDGSFVRDAGKADVVDIRIR